LTIERASRATQTKEQEEAKKKTSEQALQEQDMTRTKQQTERNSGDEPDRRSHVGKEIHWTSDAGGVALLGLSGAGDAIFALCFAAVCVVLARRT
jgi:hypothetical protein